MRVPCRSGGSSATAWLTVVVDARNRSRRALGAAPDDAAYYARFEELFGLDIRPAD